MSFWTKWQNIITSQKRVQTFAIFCSGHMTENSQRTDHFYLLHRISISAYHFHCSRRLSGWSSGSILISYKKVPRCIFDIFKDIFSPQQQICKFPFWEKGSVLSSRWLKSETAKRGNLGRVTIFFLMQELPWPLNPTGPSTTQKSDLLVCTNTRDISEEKNCPLPLDFVIENRI